jgi:hypothetical protein
MRCKLCGITKKTELQIHNWKSSQHCAKCHYLGWHTNKIGLKKSEL